jgi:hypothetical protein
VMKRLTVLALTNALVLIVLASVAASAQWTVTYTASVNTVGGPFVLVPPAATYPVPLSSVHTAKVENTSGVTQSAIIQISMRLFVEQGSVTYDSKLASKSGLWAAGDRYFVNGVFPAGVNGGQLTSNLSATKDIGLGMQTAHAFTHIMVGLISYNNDNTQTLIVKM